MLAPALTALAVLGAEQMGLVEPRLGLTLLGVVSLCQIASVVFLLRALRRRDEQSCAAAKASAEAIAAANARAQRQADLVAVTAHEIRTPLSGVLGLLDQVLAAPRLPPMTRQDAGAARQAAADLMILLRDMIAVPDGIPRDQVFRIDDLVGQVVALMRGQAAQQGTSLSTAVAPGTPPPGSETRSRCAKS